MTDGRRGATALPLRWRGRSDAARVGGQVDLWWIDLASLRSHGGSLHAILSADERERGARYVREEDRARFVVARASVRVILARYLSISAQALRFAYGPHGKPGLEVGCGSADLRFNLSHAGDTAALAIARGREVGVDVERVRGDIEFDQLAEHFFSERERLTLRALPGGRKPEAFFNCWTRKEAYLKATGAGLALPLDQFDVSLAPDEPARLLANRGDPDEVRRWSLHDLRPGPGLVGALAVEGGSAVVATWNWPARDHRSVADERACPSPA